MQRKYQYRRNLPHLQNRDCALFITFGSWKRWVLPEAARDLALESCLRANGRKCTLYVAVIMPDHVHLILSPLSCGGEYFSIPEIMRTIKSESAHRINHAMGRLVGFGRMNRSIICCAGVRAWMLRLITLLRILSGLGWCECRPSIDGFGDMLVA